jgi:hypothetical protein
MFWRVFARTATKKPFLTSSPSFITQFCMSLFEKTCAKKTAEKSTSRGRRQSRSPPRAQPIAGQQQGTVKFEVS